MPSTGKIVSRERWLPHWRNSAGVRDYRITFSVNGADAMRGNMRTANATVYIINPVLPHQAQKAGSTIGTGL